MVRTVVVPSNSHIQLDIPAEYVGKEIEITFLALDELKRSGAKKTMGDFWAVMSDDTSDALRKHIEETRDEWERGI
ncbi:hypothetical protein [Mucilaginibacter auburnensis]|uniref:Uncharacterized protein n=1 Tax=Mucilaginibacter auburnensis TaxID=1457233 RepID=A0A2H9VRF2_9SPHI|nr:hypothetical protein [Mucilaginibacter auburnensis]PJJ83369.1 hypothetical protein CLV57_0350 [Mucilaginibacter auburnensis]